MACYLSLKVIGQKIIEKFTRSLEIQFFHHFLFLFSIFDFNSPQLFVNVTQHKKAKAKRPWLFPPLGLGCPKVTPPP